MFSVYVTSKLDFSIKCFLIKYGRQPYYDVRLPLVYVIVNAYGYCPYDDLAS